MSDESPYPASPAIDWLEQLGLSVDEMVWCWDAQSGQVHFANPAFERFWGLQTQDLGHGRDALLSRIHPDDRDRMMHHRRELPRSGYLEEYRVVTPQADGAGARVAHLRERAFVGRGSNGGACITHVARDVSWQFDTTAQLRIRDISLRKAAEAALADSEAKYRQVVENVNEGILVTAAGRILYANPRALALTGLDDETARSRPFIDFIHPDDRDRVLGNHLRRLRGEQVENHYQFRVIHGDGEERWLEISAVVFEWQNAPATLNFLVDVTQRRKIEQDMRAALEHQRELSELKSRFVAVASHEFRTPLAGILSSIELLDDYGPRLPEEERKEVVGLIKNAVARMNNMIEQLLLTSRLEAGGFSFEPRPHKVCDLLLQVTREMDKAHPQAGRIVTRCEGIEQARLLDGKLVSHILVNLLGNALKYSPADSTVNCVAAAQGDQLRLSVADRGIGIPAADLPRLFESFHRGGNVGNIQGTGIGLHIVRECVQLHRGEIEVQSEQGEGATFHVTLHAPLADGH